MKYCCDGFKKWMPKFGWFTDEKKEIALMPNIDGLRVNFCPCCGKEVRSIEIPYVEFLDDIIKNS